MGRGKKGAGQDLPWRQGGASQQGGDWSLWRGSWKASPSWGRQRDTARDFPAYDESWQEAASFMEVSSSASVQREQLGGGIVKDVQSAINHARKLETRLQKIRKELLQKGRSWDAFVVKMRKAYATEQQRFQAEQQRLSGEISELEAQTQEAYSQVQHAALHQSSQRSGTQVPEPLAWESAMEVEEEHLTDAQMQAELGRILKAARATTTPKRGTGVPPMSPAGGRAGPPPGFVENVGPSDLYPTPPGSAPAKGSGPADPRAPALASVALPASDGTSHGPSLGEKLSEKRRACRSAIAPFGGARHDRPVMPEPTEDASTKPVSAPPNIVDDDQDELDAGAPSPGFGRLDG